jgi:hypothetical protein
MRLVHSSCSQGPLAHRFFLRPPPPARPARAVRRARTAAAAMSEVKRPVMARAAQVLKETFGHDDFRAGQREVIRLLLAPPDGAPARAVAVFPTGAGKSLTYQLPALLYESGVTLVVSPLLALMRDQTRALVSNGVPAASMDSTLDAQESRDVYDDVSTGKVKLLFVAPERFKNERFIRLLKRVSVALFGLSRLRRPHPAILRVRQALTAAPPPSPPFPQWSMRRTASRSGGTASARTICGLPGLRMS